MSGLFPHTVTIFNGNDRKVIHGVLCEPTEATTVSTDYRSPNCKMTVYVPYTSLQGYSVVSPQEYESAESKTGLITFDENTVIFKGEVTTNNLSEYQQTHGLGFRVLETKDYNFGNLNHLVVFAR